MKSTATIVKWLDGIKAGEIFTYSDILEKPQQKEALIKALNRMVKAGKISKLSKGRFYLPEKTAFGELKPMQSEIVRDLLEENGKTTGYLTGVTIFNNLGLTSQVSNTIQIGKNDIRPELKRDRYTISFVRQKNEINPKTIPVLQTLDIIRFMKKIPDANTKQAWQFIIGKMDNFAMGELKLATKLAMKYPPSTRAALGVIYEGAGFQKAAEELRKTLNPVTVYDGSGLDALLPNAKSWNFK